MATHIVDVTQEINLKTEPKKERNYELDFLKLVFAILVFIYHCRLFIPEDNKLRENMSNLGSVCVHFFFVVSGMLMAYSLSKQNISANYGKASINFVLKKFKSMAWPLITSITIYVIMWTLLECINGKTRTISGVVDQFIKAIPELFMVKETGMIINFNGPTWYISAMLLCMLPLVYMLYRKRDFTLYVFAPLAATFILGYMCKKYTKFAFFNYETLDIFFLGGIYRAMCGLCFGICAFTIYAKINKFNSNKNFRIFLTIAEILLYSIFFYAIFSWKKDVFMSSVLLLPIALAITFSGKSYVSCLFRFKWMRFFAPLSFSIYLNHGLARNIFKEYYSNHGFGFNIIMVTVFTIVFCVLNSIIVHSGKLLWEKKIKPAFTKPD